MEPAVEEEDSLLNASTLRGILLLGGVAAVGFIAWKYWRTLKSSEVEKPAAARIVRVPIELPLDVKKKKA